MFGPLFNSIAIVGGGLFGSTLAKHIPKRIEQGLPATFALSAFAIGITMLGKVDNMLPVVMAFIIGTALGEFLRLENAAGSGAQRLQSRLKKRLPLPRGLSQTEFSMQYTSLIVLFSASGLGVIGALTEGLTGDNQLLMMKSLMDFLTAMIFAISLGSSIIFIAVIQFVVQTVLFLLAQTIMPLMDGATFANFTALGGIIMVAIGLRIAKIMDFSVVNYLPGLILVVPFSIGWAHLGFS
ncbi:DUF554 domain-containing protein [Ferrimonas lipolytica]|uniref:DUF554 domain-containing protein n=1 Tax=Ferrimonas lipolytica TaxID=2724191 RepID=A0A6H1UB23_9GAMM|nr:DUF554 domain-containing protein [Ferrimonas lipolytica]QIZ76277.1 DUF554 domain-containing protein [Ferrimonas lipolytica]